MIWNEFREQFKKHHICGADIIGMATTYDSLCPRCEPDLPQWEEECKKLFEQGKTVRFSGYWFREDSLIFGEDMVFHRRIPIGFKKKAGD